MNIVFTIQGNYPSLSTGGPFRIVAQILEEFNKQKINLNPFLSLTNGIHPFKGRIEELILPSVKKRNLEKKLLEFLLGREVKSKLTFQYKKILYDTSTKFFWKRWRRANPDKTIIHSHITFGATPFLQHRDTNRHKVVITFHSKGSLLSDYSSDWGLKNTLFTSRLRKKEFYEICNADILTFPSLGALNLMKNDYPNFPEHLQTRIIYNGIDCQIIDGILSNFKKSENKTNYKLINVAQHVWQKRIDLLIHALAEIKNDPPIEIYNVGDGPLLEKNIELAKKLSVEKKIHFLGRKPYDEVIKLIANSDGFVMPSENVIFDLITLEAMWIGVPVIVTEDGGNLECIQDRRDGILIKKGDIHSLIDAIKYVVNPINKDAIIEMTNNAKNRIACNFTSQKMVENYLNLYNELFSAS